MNDHHQHQMLNMNQNPQMMSLNQHQPQPQQVMKPSKPQKIYNYAVNCNQDPMTMINSGSNSYLKRPHQPSNQQTMMMNRGYWGWAPPKDQLNFQNPLLGSVGGGGGFVSGNQKGQGLGPRGNWKGKKGNDKRKDGRRNENVGMSVMAGVGSGSGGISGGGGGGGYKPPMLRDLQYQNRVKAQRFFAKKKFNNNNNNHNHHSRNNMGKFAPRNTSSFLIRAKKSGGIAELVSPCPVTPAVLPTPMFSPSREDLVDMAKEEWGVDGYGSMKGLIRLRSPGKEDDGHEGDEDDEGGVSSESDVEEHAEVERRLDHDLSRFEMIYPNYTGGIEYNNGLENRVDDQDSHIAQLEEENLILKERLFFMEREFGKLRRRLQFLERQGHGGGDEINEDVVENESENDSGIHGDAHSMEYNNEEYVGENTEVYGDVKAKEENDDVDGDVQSAEDGDQSIADVEGEEEKDDCASGVKDVNVVEDVEVKVNEPINTEKTGKEEQDAETDA